MFGSTLATAAVAFCSTLRAGAAFGSQTSAITWFPKPARAAAAGLISAFGAQLACLTAAARLLHAVGRDVTPGGLNYLITRLLQAFLRRRGLSYQSLNDVRGALDNCASEFYRRVAAPYEDRKIEANGDVFDTPG